MITDLLARVEDYFLGRATGEDLWAPDIVIEAPFALPGQPTRFEGRERFLAATKASRESFPVRLEEFRPIEVHETTDPEVVVLEYELAGIAPATRTRAAARFVAVARVRDGRLVLWREYQNTAAIAAAIGQPPTLGGYRPAEPTTG